jgi:hypothetical protein
MVPKILSVTLLSLFAAAPVLGQTPAKSQKPAPAKPAAKVEPKHYEPMGGMHSMSHMGESFTLTVTGLKAENATTARSALTALTSTAYVCPECGHRSDKAGNCETCDVALERRSEKVFASATPTAEKGTIALQLDPGAKVRLSQIEGALRASSIQVDRKMLDLKGPFIAVFQGAATPEDARTIEKAVRDAGLKDARASYESATKDVLVSIRDGSGSWTMLADAGSKLEKPVRLSDVEWMGSPRG